MIERDIVALIELDPALIISGMCLYQVSSNFRKYYSYPTSSTFSVVSGSQLEFPAVTICNMNPVRGSMMNETVQVRRKNRNFCFLHTLLVFYFLLHDRPFYDSYI